MPDHPQMIVPAGHVEPVPRRIRGVRDGQVVVDTVHALYVWEWPGYPQYYLPSEAFQGVAVEDLTDDAREGPSGTVRLPWDALDAWFEEDEQVFVHPRSPYVRVDALRSSRPVRIELDGVVVADSPAPVMVFETGLPTRYYVDRSTVDFDHLVPTETVTACPYKGRTSGYWSIRVGDAVHDDLAWSYDFPTRQLLPIAGLVGFYNEKVDVVLDGRAARSGRRRTSSTEAPRGRRSRPVNAARKAAENQSCGAGCPARVTTPSGSCAPPARSRRCPTARRSPARRHCRPATGRSRWRR